MNNEQKTMLGNDWGFALIPYRFSEAITTHCNYDYKHEKIDNVLTAELGSLGKFWKFIDGVSYPKLQEDCLTVAHQENQKNACLVPLLKGVEKIIVYYKNETKEFDTYKSIFKNIDICTIDFCFENPIIKLEIHFNYDICAPLIINVKTELFKKSVVDERKVFLEKLNISHSCGSDLVNIKFQNCSEKVVLTKISLFDDKKQLMGTFKVDTDMFYKSITSLAYGKYFYKVEQLDEENKLIVETDFIAFSISAPYYGKPLVCN